ncbi:hypothetical protein [Streptomyces sp. G45]|uniref:hypothetical protein n=1 Tax=Streptomyces sp. G45 TaxID=3406627 RepID=UPI003C240CE2
MPLLATGAALPLYLAWAVFLATGGGDLAAQTAWAGFTERHPGTPYNFSWYGGLHTVNYSWISPYLMAVFGVRTVTAAAGLVSTWLAGMLCVRSGVSRPLWPALLSMVTLWCNVVCGRTTFALGVAFGLAACLAIVGTRRPWLALAFSALATLSSPVAGLYLTVVGAACLLRRDWARAAALIAPPFVVVGLTTLFFPFEGQHPMAPGRIWPPVFCSLAIVVLAPRRWHAVKLGAAVYAVGVGLTFLVDSPIGTNVERLAQLAAPVVLLAALLAPGLHVARRVALAAALVLSTHWVVDKTLEDVRLYTEVPAWARHTDGVVAALDRLGADRTRVEVVPARNHREASVLAPHVNMARGWNRQADVERGRLFYAGHPGVDVPRSAFSPAAYRAWLDRWAVGFVVLPRGARPDGPAEAEAALVRKGTDWLEPVWQDRHWRVLRVRDAVPLVSAPASVVRSDEAALVVRAPRPGSVLVRVAHSPWLRAQGACLKEAEDGFTRLTVKKPGEYRITSSYGLPRGSC